MSVFNSIVSAIFDGFFGLFGLLGGDAALWIFSALAGVLFLYIFKLTSNQTGIKRTKDRIAAGFLEVRLFKDDMGQMMRAQGRIFGSAFRYMGHALKPMAFMIIPVLLMLIQLNLWYGFRPLEVNDAHVPLQELMDKTGVPYDEPIDQDSVAVVRAKLQEGTDLADAKISLAASDGIKIITPAVRVPDLNEVSWRIMAKGDGEQNLTLQVGEKQIQQAIYVGEQDKFRKIEPIMARGAWAELWNPGLPPLPGDAPVVEFSVEYPEADTNLLGFNMHWVIIFMILSVVFGFALKGFLGVEI